MSLPKSYTSGIQRSETRDGTYVDIEGATDEDDVAWYDGIYEEFHQAVYQSMIEFLTARY